MEIINAILENEFAVFVYVTKIKDCEQIAFHRYDLVKYLEKTKLRDWINYPIKYKSHSASTMELYIYI